MSNLHVFVLHVFLTLLSYLFLALSFPQFFAITKLNGTNYKQWVESLMMNLTIIKLKLVLKVEAAPKTSAKSSINKKKFYKDRESSNSCCLMIMENHIEESVYASIPKIENAKEFLDVISKKYTKFSDNEKNELFDNH